MRIAYLLYPDFTALDLVGPYEIISRWPDADGRVLARTLAPVRCDAGLRVLPTDTPETLPDPDLIVVPGSGNPVPVLSDQVLIDWLRSAAPCCQWTAADVSAPPTGAPSALMSLHALEGRLLGSTPALPARIKALRGYPIVINALAQQAQLLRDPPTAPSPHRAPARRPSKRRERGG
jgi:putative intracellular protease/amidase